MPSITVTTRSWAADPAGVRREADDLGYPLFVKPARGGSSIGISKVHDAGELEGCLALAFEHDPKVLVEVAAQDAREVECGVLQVLQNMLRNRGGECDMSVLIQKLSVSHPKLKATAGILKPRAWFEQRADHFVLGPPNRGGQCMVKLVGYQHGDPVHAAGSTPLSSSSKSAASIGPDRLGAVKRP